MVYDDPLSKKSLEVSPYWPPRDWFEDSEEVNTKIEEELSRLNFDLEEWLEYKKNVPNDGRPRPHTHPDVEYPLTNEELEALKNNRILRSPILCPKYWELYTQTFNGEVEKRFWWLGMQMGWVEWGYPPVPRIIWKHSKFFLKIYSELVYKPFIKKWGVPPDDFWVKLSYHIEQENHDSCHHGLTLVFKSQGRIFPTLSLYDYDKDPEPYSLFLPPDFWNSIDKVN